ncbi:YdcF family protein [Gordonia sp. ABSL11-1]|uniref:YdcF family protein n=1 Tax=Gordonia sp. ABSL11-1 TaxID=3053924 RepID=UPI0025741276|nr:YdcF family protein [Gordonia sp. ABSL11-1]MDL9944821.1 YdcF family protein [Gordonia sp. ABSL11-1]
MVVLLISGIISVWRDLRRLRPGVYLGAAVVLVVLLVIVLVVGVDAIDVVLEDSSTDTEENLTYSARLLAERGIRGPVAVVTSDYQAFRAATLMRNAGIDGFSTGAHTASHFFPNAQNREFIAILREHLWLDVGIVVVPVVPWIAGLIQAL